MKKRNIYQNRSQELFHLFEKAGNNSKVMCVPIDYAKKDHVVMFCNGYSTIDADRKISIIVKVTPGIRIVKKTA